MFYTFLRSKAQTQLLNFSSHFFLVGIVFSNLHFFLTLLHKSLSSNRFTDVICHIVLGGVTRFTLIPVEKHCQGWTLSYFNSKRTFLCLGLSTIQVTNLDLVVLMVQFTSSELL